MKDTNFDSIKEKFDNSGVNAPDALNEELLLEKLNNAAPVEMLPPKKSKKRIAAGISAAAAVALVTAGAFTFTNVFGNQPQPKELTAYHTAAGLRGFKNVDELKALMRDALTAQENNNRYGNLYAGGLNSYSAGAGGSMDIGVGESAHNSTYVQHVGVDEADTVKTDGTFIYSRVGYSDTIFIFTADGENAKKVGTISLDSDNENAESYIDNFYLYGDKLVVLGEKFEDGLHYTTTANAYVYDVSDKANIRLLDSFSQSGTYVDSRMIDGTLYLVSNQFFRDENDMPVIYDGNAATADSAVAQQVPVDCVYSVECPADCSFLLVSRFDTDKGDHTTKAILGSAGTVYCNRDNLYITAPEYTQETYDTLTDASFNRASADYVTAFLPFFYSPSDTHIIKLSLEKDIDFAADGRVKGMISNQYALDEYEGNLRVATTTIATGNGRETANHLFVLDKDLQQIGEVAGIAPGEMIQAVRYIEDTAYVITYQQTDPLFVIDLKNPEKPTVLGELKIDGFSTVLIPVDDNTLLGIGFNTSSIADLYGEEDPAVADMQMTDGLKLVLFDVSDKANPKALDEKIFKDYDSEVQFNPRALVVNNERGDYTLPYRKLDDETDLTGLLNFRVENGKIIVVDDCSFPKASWDARCVYVGDNQYLLGTESSLYDDENHGDAFFIKCVPYK